MRSYRLCWEARRTIKARRWRSFARRLGWGASAPAGIPLIATGHAAPWWCTCSPSAFVAPWELAAPPFVHVLLIATAECQPFLSPALIAASKSLPCMLSSRKICKVLEHTAVVHV